jgi:hypothetical protein
MEDPFDLDSLRVDSVDPRFRQPQPPTRVKKWRRQFIKFPWTWATALQSATRVSTFKLALLLLYESWRMGGRPIVLSNILSQAEGLSRRSKWNALAELEALGLIRVERRKRRSPVLVLRHLDGGQS